MAKTTGCLQAANKRLRSQKQDLLEVGGSKQPRAYDLASRPFRKPKLLRQAAPHNPSLGIFVGDLDARASEVVN